MENEITFVFVMDGNMWSCHVLGMDNLAVDPFGFGATKKEALEELMDAMDDGLGL